MAELTGSVSAHELTKRLLCGHNILIKDLSQKMNGKQYIRIAVRDTKDNDRLLNALIKELR